MENSETKGDREIEAMMSLSRALSSLEDDERARVLRWAADRYGVRISVGSVKSETRDEVDTSGQEGSLPLENVIYHRFAELFDAVDPKTDGEKALVAAYWSQILQHKESFLAAEVNKELKHMGHELSNVTDALSWAQEQKPALVIQLRKSGHSQQARKTYKVTPAGKKFVDERI